MVIGQHPAKRSGRRVHHQIGEASGPKCRRCHAGLNRPHTHDAASLVIGTDADGRVDCKSGLFGHDWRNGPNLSSRRGWLAKLIPNKVKALQKIIAPTRLTNIPGAIK